MKSILKYLEDRQDSIHALLGQPRKTSVFFHALRVEIKKLHAVFDLIACCSKDFDKKKYFQPFKKIFQQAGKVRELQVEEAFVKHYLPQNKIAGYRKKTREIQAAEQAAFLSMIPEAMVSFLDKTFLEIKPFTIDMDDEKAAAYMRKKRKRIKKDLLQKTIKTAVLHQLRKRLKIYYYNQIALNAERPPEDSSQNNILPHLLGKWHDYEVTANHLKELINSGDLKPIESKQFEDLCTQILSGSNRVLLKIKKNIPSSEFLK